MLALRRDERVTAEFVSELKAIVTGSPQFGGYYVPSKLMLGEHWIRFSSGFPVYQVRLFHRERLRFADHGHGQREVTLYPIGYMKEPYLHYAFSKGFTIGYQNMLVTRYRRRSRPLKTAVSPGLLSLIALV